MVDLSRLQGFHFCFAPKMRSNNFQGAEFASSVTFIWCLRFHSDLNGTRHYTPTKTIERACISSSSKEWAKDFKRKLMASSG